eukprot:TRINITY_DN18777_c0_g1_i1.p1 TRINITY_DN18777_c0_g1~~TRINITY_DN18777_c0_g1_i1.p1  ORF type:complete len:502 (-),score=123.80 TRINITY_DN18777_c0_g1_i1:655-2160(-)
MFERNDHRAAGGARQSYTNPFDDESDDHASHARGHGARRVDSGSKVRTSRGSTGGPGLGSNPFDDEDDVNVRSKQKGVRSRGGSDGAAAFPASVKNPFDDAYEEHATPNRAGNGRHTARSSMGGGFVAQASRTPPPARPPANPFGDDSDDDLPAHRGTASASKANAMPGGSRSRTPPPSFYSSAGAAADADVGRDHEKKKPSRAENENGDRRRFFAERSAEKKERDGGAGRKVEPAGATAGRVPTQRASRTSAPGSKASRSELLEYGGERRRMSELGPTPGARAGGPRGLGGDEWHDEEEMKMMEMGETSRTIERCQQIANETLNIASGTLDTLHKQGEQIQRTHEAAVRVDQELSKGEKLLGSLGPMFGWRWKPKKTKDITGPAYHASDSSYKSKGSSENRAALGLGKAKPKDSDSGFGASEDRWSQHGARSAYDEEKSKQDDALGDLSNVVAQLKDMSTTMGQEMERQNVGIDHLVGDMQELDNRVKGANERGKRLLRR